MLFTVTSVLIEMSIADWRYDIVVSQGINLTEDVLIIDQIPTVTRTKKVKEKEIEYQSYAKNFSYPSYINLSSLVRNAIRKNKKIVQYPPINLQPFKYINLPAGCKLPTDDNSTKRILVLVKSFVGNVEMRIAIRSLWEKINDPYMTRVFMLGEYPKDNPGRRWPIDRENRIYKDIIQKNFVDAYFNNTIKTVMGFNWAVRLCPQADLMLFHDDDYHVLYNDLAVHLRKVLEQNKTDIYTGSLAVDAKPYRNRGERWFITTQQYPFDVFPPYIGGGAYAVSSDVARKLQMAFPHVQYLGIDDVFLGIVARKLNLKLTSDLLMDSLYAEALAQECSHNADELFKRQCILANRKREIANTHVVSYNSDGEFNNTNSLNLSVSSYLSFEKTFLYPLEANIRSAVNGKILHNHIISLRNINAHPFLYFHQPAKCNFEKKNKNIIIFIKSYIKNVEQRVAIRSMWNGSLVKYPTSVKLVFLLAQGIHSGDQIPIDKEDVDYGDILQEDFKEHHRNNTLKVVMALNWVMTNKPCSLTNLILFLDDDYFVHPKQLLIYLQGIKNTQSVFGGKVMKKQIPSRKKHDKKSLTYKEYPYDKFPTYVKGGAFLFSYNVARKFQLSFPYVKYIPIDDVYLGIVAMKLNIEPKLDPILDHTNHSALAYECSHIASRLRKGVCPLRGHHISSVPKVIKRRDGYIAHVIKSFLSFFKLS